MSDTASVDIAALVNILNAVVSLVNENERLRNLVRMNGATGQQAETAPVNSAEESLPGQAGEGQEG